jgi:hypothetical protein
MSSSTLTHIQNQIILYEYPIFLVLGNIGNVFIVVIFSRRRQNACSFYLISLAIMNDLYLTFNSFMQVFPLYYQDETIRAVALCKLRIYVSNVFGQSSKTMLVFACIDRFMITSDQVNIRAFSTVKRAKYHVFLAIIFWLLFAIYRLITTTIANGQCGAFGNYATLNEVDTLVFFGFIPAAILSIFGYLTYRNMRRRQLRIQPMVNSTNGRRLSIKQRDRDLVVIVISEVFVFVITITPVLFVSIERMIHKYITPNQSVQYTEIENLIFYITFSLVFVNSTAPFYIYLISSKSFRRDFKQLIIRGYQKLTRQQH